MLGHKNKKTGKNKHALKRRLGKWWRKLKIRYQSFMKRRPHRTFRLTKRRDYRHDIKIEGYFAFSASVIKNLWRERRIFGWFVILYAALSAVFVGLISNQHYRDLSEQMRTAISSATGSEAPLTEALVLFGASFSGMFNVGQNETQQIVGVFLIFYAWLVVVWLLRKMLAGKKVKLRDALYSAGSPIMASIVIAMVMFVQLLPILLGVIALTTLQAMGIFESGVEAMAAWTVVALLATLSLYWLSSSFIALIVVTLPGVYPFAALKAAGDLVLGRRLKVMLRLLWALAAVLLFCLVVVVPVIMLDSLISIDWLPLIPTVVLLVGAISLLWFTAYVYLLYRRLIDGEDVAATAR